MASSTQGPVPALGDTFKKPLFGTELESWLERATPAERERFERVFESIRSITESKKSPDAHHHFVQATMEKLKQHGSSAATPSTSQNSRTSSGRTAPVGGPTVPAAGGAGWTYTSTRSARHDRPETRIGARPASPVKQPRPQAQPASPSHAPDAEWERPLSAPGQGAGKATDREAALTQAATRRRAISFGYGGSGAASPEPGPGPTGSIGTGRGTGFVPISPHVTNYQESYNLRSCYPEVYDKAMADTKIDPADNKTFQSEWGDSLKAAADECSKLYMRTTYNSTNDEVVRYRTDAEAIREREFFKWMLRQKSFYGDLLSKASAKDLEALMHAASDEQRREILEALRSAHAVADPCFDRTRSHSQAVHCEMRRLEETQPLSRLQMNTKLRIMGALEVVAQRKGGAGGSGRRPATATPVTLSVDDEPDGAAGGAAGSGGSRDRSLKPSARRPATAGAALLARASSVPRPPVPHGEKHSMFRSKAPLTWPSGQVGPSLSTYVEDFGGAKIGAGHARPNSALWRVQPIKPVDASTPYGAVNPHTAAAPLRGAYPVPEGFLHSGLSTFPPPQGMTTNRAEFAPRDTSDLVAQLRAATALAENGRKTLERSTLPLGPKTGVNLIPSAKWVSENHDEYVQHQVDHREPFQRAEAMRTMFSGPTASAGKVAGAR
ncbi:hypothetical protein GPECTOR_9g649 [Gonium pectorale]|uniref:Uncharacterized protein n=1 Tax=Gonium pectorale TaxID=33097 RepID=A0A150GS53_GONPE|nr:hypothetical protein GPECTOR_9g649 [Gonium pectorale]|eukprot:KXZ52604.1 hypothetical protein GPECTOR_9g649 [Gonium pectorale]